MSVFDELSACGEIYIFRGFGNLPAQCGLTTVEREGRVLLIFSELTSNEGTSVTNAIEQLATEVYQNRYSHLPPESITVVEHYGPTSDRSDPRDMEEFDHVKLSWTGTRFIGPNWRRLKEKDFLKLLPEGSENV